MPGLRDLAAVLERQREDLAGGDQDHAEVERGRRDLQDRQHQVVDELFTLSVEPFGLLLELRHRLPPPGRRRLAVGGAPVVVVHHRPPRDKREHRRRSELAEQEPRHAADTDPTERRQQERDREAQLHTRLLRNPRHQRVDELPVEEYDLEEHHEQLHDDHLDDVLPLPLLQSVHQGLNAREATHDEQQQEEVQDGARETRRRLATDEVGEELGHGRHERVAEDGGLEHAPEDEHHERDPGHAGPEVGLRHPAGHREGHEHDLADHLEHELRHEGAERHRPPQRHPDEPEHPHPVQPDGAHGIPPRQHHRRDELHAPRAERQRVDGELCAPDRGDGEQSREEQEEELRGDEPQRTRGEEEIPQRVLYARNPRQRRDQQIRQLTPRFWNSLNQLEHFTPPCTRAWGTSA